MGKKRLLLKTPENLSQNIIIKKRKVVRRNE